MPDTIFKNASRILPFTKEAPWLAPLAGYSDLPFRLLCREHGAAVCCTEMISAKGLLYNSPGTKELLQTIPEDNPLVCQIFGAESDILAEAICRLRAEGHLWFDLNMGCSVPKVTRTASGAALLKNPDHVLKVAEAIIRAAGKGHAGFKIRLGWDNKQDIWHTLPLELERLGAGWITLHPRYARQGFGGEAQWECLKTLKQQLSIPLIASGDLFSAADGMRCLQETSADTVMYARGAMQNPAIFMEHRSLLQGTPPLPQSREVIRERIRRHAILARQYGNEHTALFKMRTFVPRYVRHIPGVRVLRQELSRCTEWEHLEHALDSFFTYTAPTQTI